MKFYGLFLLALVCVLTARAEDPATFEVGGLNFSRPADWKWVEVTSPMRKAQLKISGPADQSADVVFFYFGAGGGGDVNANIQRWLGQFKAPEGAAKTEARNIHGVKVTLASTEGTFSSGMPGGPTTALENYALFGAIIEAPEGNVFIKLTGPAALVNDLHTKFLDFITNAIPAKK